MSIIGIPAFTDNYIWLLIDDNKKTALCVDPGEAAPLIRYLHANQLTLEAIMLTHHHYDHVNGLSELLNQYPSATVYGPDDPRILTGAHHINTAAEFTLLNFQFHVLKIPGHTSSHICFYETNFGLLFCGDTLFSAGCGRIFDGSPELMLESLLQLKALPEDTQVFCGHEYTRNNLRFAAIVEPNNSEIQNHYKKLMNHPTENSLPSTIGLEKKINPFLRLDEPEVIAYAKQRGCQLLNTLSVFKQIRHDKDDF